MKKLRVIGHTYKGVEYTDGHPSTWEANRAHMTMLPAYIFIHDTTGNIVLIDSYYNVDGSRPDKSISVVIDGPSNRSDKERSQYQRYLSNKEAIQYHKAGWRLLYSMDELPGAQPIYEEYEVNILPSIDGCTFELHEHDELLLTECGAVAHSVKVNSDCQLKLDGANIDSVIAEILRRESVATCNYVPSLCGYNVTAPFGIIEDQRTYTDIGGHYLEVLRGDKQYQIVHLHNGFGDGRYTLRFRGDRLVR